MDLLLMAFNSFGPFYAHVSVNCRMTDSTARGWLPFKKEKPVQVVARGIFFAKFSCRKKADALKCITPASVTTWCPGQMSPRRAASLSKTDSRVRPPLGSCSNPPLGSSWRRFWCLCIEAVSLRTRTRIQATGATRR